ncbi:MAG: 50S ribosomal protein L21 [Candidatus Omnitrophota bacterium]
MYAIVEIDKKQYRVEKGDGLEVEKIKRPVNGKIVLDKVLLICDKNITIGRPYIKGAKVIVSAEKEVKGPKVTAYKYKRRKGYHRAVGHRQTFTRLSVKDITLK